MYTYRNVLIGLLGFLGLGAMGGGVMLILSPDGSLMGLPLTALGNAPFPSFLIPGLILFLVLGVAPCLLIPALLKKPVSRLADGLNLLPDMHWAWTFSVYTAFALIIWIQTEMVFQQTVHWLHTCYMGYALVLIFVTLLPTVRNLYRK